MPKKPNTKVGSDIYAAAEKEAANLPSELHFKLDGVTLKRGRHQHCRSGAHRTKSIYGGYGHLCYKEFAYEHFSFTISFNSDFPTPHIEFVYKNKGHNEVSINVKLTENYWKSTNMMLEVQKAYHALTMDFEEVVEQ